MNRSKVWWYLVTALALAVAIPRPFLQPGTPTWLDGYKSVAHIMTGILIGGWIYSGNLQAKWLVILLSLMEVTSAVVQHLR